MKTFVSALFAIAVLAAGSYAFTNQANDLNGTWVPVQQEIGGKALPRISYEDQRMVLLDTAYTVYADFTDKGVVKRNGNKMDIYGKEGVNAGRHFTAIYQLQNGRLTVCYNLAGDKYPEGFDTEGKQLYFMSVFKRIKGQ